MRLGFDDFHVVSGAETPTSGEHAMPAKRVHVLYLGNGLPTGYVDSYS